VGIHVRLVGGEEQAARAGDRWRIWLHPEQKDGGRRAGAWRPTVGRGPPLDLTCASGELGNQIGSSRARGAMEKKVRMVAASAGGSGVGGGVALAAPAR
jgi:hypothetical protein